MIGDMAQALGTEPTELPCLDDLTAYAYVSGALPDDRRTTVIAHLDGCAACRELVDEVTLGRKLGESTTPLDFGTYRLGVLIAQGGMGRIYRAFDTSLQRDVALKVPRSASPAMMRRFEREAAITARLQHPGIVPIHAAGHTGNGTPFYVMRLIDGRTLDRIVEGSSAAARLALVEHVVAVAETMAYVHDKQIVHRDLKPNNVLIGEFGETLIIDWGLAKRLTDDRASLPVIGVGSALDTPATRDALRTRAGDVLGTPAFMSPEQAAGEAVDARSDVYAIGAVLRYVIAGRVTAPTEPLDTPEESARLVAVAHRATAVRKEDRFANAGELLLALRAAIAPPSVVVERRRWMPALLAAAIVAGITALLVWGLWPRSTAITAEQLTIVKLPSDALRPALSPSGKRVTYGSHNRLEVRELESGRRWTHTAWLAWPYTVEFPTDDIVMFAETLPAQNQQRMVRWNLLTDTTEQVGPAITRSWIGTFEDGSVWIRDVRARALVVSTPTGDIALPSKSERPVRIFAISSDHRRLVFVESTQDGEHLRLVEGMRGRTFTSPVVDITAVTFLDPSTVLYASGSLDGSRLYRMPIGEGAFGRPEAVFTTPPSGWLGTLSSSGGRLVGSWVSSSFESRLHERASHHDRLLDKVAVSAPLGWRDTVSYWAFNNATRQIERHSSMSNELPVITAINLSGDPANATQVDELLIITLRGGDGRQVFAFHPDEAKPRWTAARGALAFVRCAGDRVSPCVAGKRSASGNVVLVRIDPTTGVLGEQLSDEADIADAAIDAPGGSLAWVVDNSEVHEKPLQPGGRAQVVTPRRSGIQTIAYDPTGGILIGSNTAEGRSIVRLSEGRVDPVVNVGQTILSMVRPSPDGTQLLYRVRTLTSDLVEIRLP